MKEIYLGIHLREGVFSKDTKEHKHIYRVYKYL